MRSFYSLTFLLVCLSLAACQAPVAPAARHYAPPGNPGGRLCSLSCQQAKESCLDKCIASEKECWTSMQTKAIAAYEAYTTARLLAHQPLDRKPRDFETPGQCRDQDCRDSCDSAYDDCFEECGGKIISDDTPSP